MQMEQSRGYHRMRVAKACLSCRQRKVKCDRPSTTGKCKACQRRRTECVMSDALENPSNRSSVEQSSWSWVDSHADLVHGLSLARPMRGPEYDPFSTVQDQRDVFGLDSERDSDALLEGLAPDPFLDPDSGLVSPSHMFGGLSTAGVGLDSPYPALDMLFSSPCFALPRCLLNPSETAPSVFPLFSPSGLQWFQSRAGDKELDKTLPLVEKIVAEDDSDDEFDLFTSTPRSTPYLPLPPKSIALRLFNVYFARVNPFCPLFDEEDFMYRIDKQYPVQPQSSPTWWACINTTLALACMVEEEFLPNAWQYWKNCSMSLGSFLLQPPQLLAAQALLGMTLFLFGNFGSKPSDALVSMAIRILHALDFTNGRPGEPIDVYKRILSLCYAQDIETALRTGIPPIQNVDIMSLSGPESRWEDFAPTSGTEGIPGFNIYNAFCALTVIKSQVYRELYSALADDKHATEVIASVGDLDQQLLDWKSTIPEEYRPESTSADIGIRKDPHLTVLYMHFSYYNCLTTIHRRGIECATWAMQLGSARHPQVRPSNPRALLSRQVSIAAARASLDLVRYITPDHILCAGLVSAFVDSAVTTLSSLIVQDPSTARVKADMERMRNVERFYSAVSVSRTDREVFGFLEHCAHHRMLAEKAIKRSLRSRMALTTRR